MKNLAAAALQALGAIIGLTILFGLISYARSAPPLPKIIAQATLKPKIMQRTPKIVGLCDCNGPADCACRPGACACAACAVKRKQDQYAEAYKLSLDTGKPLVLFVNCRIPVLTPPIDFITCPVSELNGRKGPCVVIACDRHVCGELQGTPTAAEIQAAVGRCRQTTAAPVMQYYQPAPMFFGGGGGGGDGGC